MFRNRISPDRRKPFAFVTITAGDKGGYAPGYYVKDTLTGRMVDGPFEIIGQAQAALDRRNNR